MLRSSSSFSVAARVFGLAAALSFAPALAQDCQLAVRADRLAIAPGEIARVHVFARFPVSAYAFASAQFRVFADLAGWLVVSSGVVIGDDVFNINVSQNHQPFLGVIADPSNPRNIWTGQFQPSDWTPRLVRFESSPIAFSVYPNLLTPTTAPCVADPTRDYLLVNPQRVARFGVAPGEGTAIQRTGLSQIRAQGPGASAGILIGLLLPAVQKGEEGPRFVLRSGTPLEQVEQSLVPAPDVEAHPVAVLAWARTNGSSAGGVRVSAGDIHGVEFQFFRGGVRVGSTAGARGALVCALPELPRTYSSRILHDRRAGRTHVVGRGEFAREQTLSIPGLGAIVCDTIEAHAVQHNLKQLGIGMHVYETRGPGTVNVALLDGSVR
ncbi:MAG: hypothetical protein JNM84_28220 [Planctomycetes bacterium]|nr:hypothetical protein [Planctomycetota bacterium]